MPRIALNTELPAGDTPPDSVELIPAGPQVVGRDGRRWLFDAPSHASVLNLFTARNAKLPIDWEHATQHRAPKGEEAPAAAWINSLRIVDGALVGDVEWNKRGGAQVVNREYIYLSPVFDYDSATGRIVRLVSAGLTNTPNLHLPALNQEEDVSMKLSQAIVAALGISADATDDAAVAAINQLKTAANSEQAPKLDQYVPRADYNTLLTRATNAENALAERSKAEHKTAVDGAIDGALKAGKITPATADYHRASCSDQAGLERFRAFVGAAPVVAADTDLGKRKVDTALNAEDIADKARAFQTAQAAAGITVSTTAAVRHVLAGAK
jgi:phage I-like protein